MVMPGLVPGIHAFLRFWQDVDAMNLDITQVGNSRLVMTSPAMTEWKSEIQHQPRRILEILFHAHEEGDRLAAVDNAVVVGKR